MESGNLPGDLIVEILSKVPAKSLARFRSTSKQCNALLKSRSFAKKHSANAPKEESLVIISKDLRVYLMTLDLQRLLSLSAVKVASELYFKDPLFTSSKVDILKVFHCDGLLLCTTADHRLVVWNPCTGETKWIKPRLSYKETDCYALGYYNKPSCKQYKILRVDCRQHVDGNYHAYDLYDLTSDSWRFFGTSSDQFVSPYGISVKGNTYWVASDVNALGNLYPNFLLSFDFSTECFVNQPLPHPIPDKVIVALSVVRELEQLCMYYSNRHSGHLDVWVATSTGSTMSWSKFVTFPPLYSESYANYAHFDGVSFLADENKVVVCCDNYWLQTQSLHILGDISQTERLIRHVGDSPFRSDHPLFLNYVPSLAQIQQ